VSYATRCQSMSIVAGAELASDLPSDS